MSTHWLVGPLVGWLLAGWSDGPLVRPPCRGYRSDAANLGWFNSQLPLLSIWLNATPDAIGKWSKGPSNHVVMHRHDMSHRHTFSMHFKPIICFSFKGASFLLFVLV